MCRGQGTVGYAMVHTKIGTFLFKLSGRAKDMHLTALKQNTERLAKFHHVVPPQEGKETSS